MEKKTVNVKWTINLPMSVPVEWDDRMIDFYINESSWCCSNLIELLEKYDKEHGCICEICEAEVVEIGGN